jgi:uncharacterized membrane protein YdjX (TVP38/TMEM64 family)
MDERPIPAPSRRTALLKTCGRIAAVSVVAAGIVLAIVHRNAIDPAVIRNTIAGEPLAPVVFVLLQVAASLLFVPRSVMGAAAGLVFGMFWGLVWAVIGAVAGAAAGFAFVRWMGAGGTLDASPRIGRLIAQAERGGWRAVAIVRLTPIPHSIANTALALTKLSWGNYLIGSAAGMLPMTVAQVGVGAAGAAVLGRSGWIMACLLLAAALGASFLLKRVLKR